MKRHFRRLTAAVLLLSFSALMPVALGQDPQEPKAPHPTLQALKLEIEKIAKESMPGAKAQFVNDTLVAEYKTRPYMVHTHLKTGEFAETSHEQTGPSAEGIMLRLYVGHGKEYLGERVIRQDFHETYWMEYLDARAIKDKNEHVWMELAYGFKADPKTVDALKAAVAGVEKQ